MEKENLQEFRDIQDMVGCAMVLQDNPEIALSLFKLINLIVEKMITEPKEIEELYATMPEGATKSIEKRDER